MATVMFDITAKGRKLGTVKGVPSVTGIGYWALGDCWKPDTDAIRECLPYQWRKAWDRAGSSMWFDKDNNEAPCYRGLRYLRGGSLALVFAAPYVFTTELERLGK